MNIYEYQRPVGKIDDVPELRGALIAVYDGATHEAAARFCIVYGRRLIEIMSSEVGAAVGGAAFCAVPIFDRAEHAILDWLDKKVNYQAARSVGGEFNDLARTESCPTKARFYRTLAQLSCVTHVKYHALWACDFAVTLINRLHPGDIDAARRERAAQTEMFAAVSAARPT